MITGSQQPYRPAASLVEEPPPSVGLERPQYRRIVAGVGGRRGAQPRRGVVIRIGEAQSVQHSVRGSGGCMRLLSPWNVTYAADVTHDQYASHRGEITVNEQGRVTIPVQVRRAAGIEAGVPLVVYVEDGRVVIETRDQLADRIRRDVTATWTGDGSVVDELITDRRAEAVREEQR